MEAVVRHRATVVMAVVVLMVVLATLVAGKSKNAAGGAGVPHVVFGAQVQKLGAGSQLTYTNGWIASTAKQLIAVYAGRASVQPRNGLFVILRRTGGRQKLTSVTVPGSGAVTLLRPSPPATEQAAFAATLHFVTANGATGTLSLSGDSVKLGG